MTNDRWYVVGALRKWGSVTVLGVPLDGYRAAPGCVGFLPVFETEEQAEAWKREQGHGGEIIQIERA